MAEASRSTSVPAHVKAHTTGRWAEIIFRALSTKVANRWQFVSFRGLGKGEWRGVVDVIAIRKDTTQPSGRILKRGDLFDIVLIQIKGGSPRGPSAEDKLRLREVANQYRARAIVQFQWQRGKTCKFSLLEPSGEWKDCTGTEVFG
ncbi:MAG: hypothetical protein ACREBC_10535 [Pyrinomonadaceae bacterium]